jgi:DNA processing protein
LDDTALWIALRDTPGIPRPEARRLLEEFKGPRAVFSQLGKDPPLGPARQELARARSLGFRAIPRDSPAFPPRLLEIPDPPFLIYVAGRIPEGEAVSIVGSRRPTPRARDAAGRFAGALARAGLFVVSGLAYGVDAAAHAGALEEGGATVAVLAGGLDRAGPSGNMSLARRILARGGGWISEHPPGTEPLPYHFPDRNRLISGLSEAVLIVEAREKSGTLWTASHAADQGRNVFAVPGPIDSETCRGSNRLLVEGAGALAEPRDAVRIIAGLMVDEPPLEPDRGPSGEPGRVVRQVVEGPCGVDDLVRDLGLDPARLAAILLDLELDGWVVRQGRRIAVGPKARKN